MKPEEELYIKNTIRILESSIESGEYNLRIIRERLLKSISILTLPKHEPNVVEFKIKSPIWKNHSVGLDLSKALPDGLLYVQIEYVSKKTGEKIYPHIYSMHFKDAIKYPTQIVRGVKLHIIPIVDFKIKINKNEG